MTPKTFRYLLASLFVISVLGLCAYAFAPTHTITKGLAQLDWSHNEDRTTIGITQFYAWGMDSCGVDYVHCTPMNRNWDVSAQTICPPIELLGNEPTNLEPAGHPIDASVAASVTVAIEQACPSTQIVAANIHIVNPRCGTDCIDEVVWLNDYFAAYQALTGDGYGSQPNPDGRYNLLGMHAYCYHPYDLGDGCIDRLKRVEAQTTYSGRYWITETGIPQYLSGALGDWQSLLSDYALDPRIDRVYGWTNRCQCGDYMDMVAADGTLTPYGQAFHDWQPMSYQVYAPNVTVGATQGYP